MAEHDNAPEASDARRQRHDKAFTLGGRTAADFYDNTQTGRQDVLRLARTLCELTIPSIMPEEGYLVGQNEPGNNQSMGAQAHSNLASNLMYMAFPPGQPMCRFEPDELELQPQVTQDPDMWQKTQLAMSRLEMMHRKKANNVGLSAVWGSYLEILLGAGNGLWKHTRLEAPKAYRPDCYVVMRDADGHPLITAHKETVKVYSLAEDIQDLVYSKCGKELLEKPEWDREVDIYSVCKLVRKPEHRDEMDWYWEYWQEWEGELLPDTDQEHDYEDCPMWAGWLIPVYGQNWGRSYLERYRGDLYTLEAAGSGLNDGTAIASWSMALVKPGGTTNLRQITNAPNLSVLPGVATDITFPVTNKMADMNFVGANFDRAARRVAAAFLMQRSIQREGERVTKEEIVRLGADLDKAMGGLYTTLAKSDQVRMVTRFIRLHEDARKKLPKLPRGLVSVQVTTGVDALGRSLEDQALTEALAEVIPHDPTGEAGKMVNWAGVLTAKFAAKGLKPDGLIKSQEQVGQENDAARKQAMQQELLSKGAGPVAGALAKGMAEGGMPAPGGGDNPAPPPGPAPQGAAP